MTLSYICVEETRHKPHSLWLPPHKGSYVMREPVMYPPDKEQTLPHDPDKASTQSLNYYI